MAEMVAPERALPSSSFTTPESALVVTCAFIIKGIAIKAKIKGIIFLKCIFSSVLWRKETNLLLNNG